MNKKFLEHMYEKLFVPVLIMAPSVIGYILYNQGKADVVHELAQRGWLHVPDEETE